MTDLMHDALGPVGTSVQALSTTNKIEHFCVESLGEKAPARRRV
jgi:hypothetical protein